MSRKFAALVIMLMMCSTVFAAELPDVVGGFHCVSEYIQPLTTEYNGEIHGRVIYRTYRRDKPAGTLDVILTEGTGTGGLYVPERVNASRGVMPSDGGFGIVDISGCKAIIEQYSYMPLSLAVNFSRDITLTIETLALDEKGIIKFAEDMAESLKNQ